MSSSHQTAGTTSEEELLASDVEYDSIEVTEEDDLELTITDKEVIDLSEQTASINLKQAKRLRETSLEDTASLNSSVKSPPIKKIKKIMMDPPELPEVTESAKQVVRLVPDLEDVHLFGKTHLEMIHKNVLKILKNEKNPAIKFDFCNHERGRYKFVCPNEDSKNFAMNIVPKLTELWKDPKVAAVHCGAVPKMIRASVTLANPVPDILDLFEDIDAKNEAIDTNEWRIYSRKKTQGNKTVIFFGVDAKSAENIKAVGFRPYAHSRIRINIDDINAE